MCGIAGIYKENPNKSNDLNDLLEMLGAIAHRGPDNSATWSSEKIFLGHNRLSIIDLSPAGDQPMTSSSNRFTIVFNGEIYNFKELRKELKEYQFNGNSDTEVILAMYEKYGNNTFEKLNGMFAIAIWDEQEKKLILARDRFGEKPLYFYHKNKNFYFASEIKAIEKIHSINLSIDRNSVKEQSERGFISAPNSIYKEIRKLPPATFAIFKDTGEIFSHTYWSLAETIKDSKNDIYSDKEDSIEGIKDCLEESIRLRMISDVPLGAFLSGGIDSSLIVSMMQSISSNPIKTFTIGFNEDGFDEAAHAKKIANRLGTDHHEEYLTASDALNIIPDLGLMYDEPFSDSSQIPTHLVSKITRKHVTVALSGDAGDELFCGYSRYFTTLDIWNKLRYLPFRAQISKFGKSIHTDILNSLFHPFESLANNYSRTGKIGKKIKTLLNWIDADSFESFYRKSLCHSHENGLVIGSNHVYDIWKPKIDSNLNKREWMMYEDSISYLPGDILTKVDRAAMSVSLETRIPFLDPKLAAAAWRLPANLRNNKKSGKIILKKLLASYLPEELTERPKMGFGVPIQHWLRSDLKSWTNDLLSHDRIKNQGLYDPKIVERLVTNHMNGTENNSSRLWDILMMQSWIEADESRKNRLDKQ